jgi:hypothetical protein
VDACGTVLLSATEYDLCAMTSISTLYDYIPTLLYIFLYIFLPTLGRLSLLFFLSFHSLFERQTHSFTIRLRASDPTFMYMHSLRTVATSFQHTRRTVHFLAVTHLHSQRPNTNPLFFCLYLLVHSLCLARTFLI